MSVDMSITTKRLRKMIDESGLNRKEIANSKDLHCDVSTIAKHYNGDREVNTDFIVRYANFFHVSTDYLLGCEDKKNDKEMLHTISDFTGLSEEVILILHDCYECVEMAKSEGFNHIDHAIFEIMNKFITSGSLFAIADRVAEYREALIKGNDEYCNLIQRLDSSLSIDDFNNWLVDANVADTKKELYYSLFLAQEEVKNFMNEYTKNERETLDNKKGLFAKLHGQKELAEEGEEDGNNQETQ